MQISACVITKNEEQNIGRYLACVKVFADEIIVVDTGSTDNTVAIAKKAGACVAHFAWQNDFAAAKNFALAKAKGDWIVFLDADEYFSPSDVAKIRPLLEGVTNRKIAGLITRLINITSDGRDMGTGFDAIRIFRNLPYLRYEGSIHEHLKNFNLAVPLEMKMIADVRIYHTGYSPEIIAAKAKRNIDLILSRQQQGKEQPLDDYFLAEGYYSIKDYSQAIARARLAIKSPVQAVGQEKRPYQILLESLILSNAPLKELDAALAAALSKFPQAADIYFIGGEGFFVGGSYLESEKLFSRGLELLKSDADNTMAQNLVPLANKRRGEIIGQLLEKVKSLDTVAAIEFLNAIYDKEKDAGLLAKALAKNNLKAALYYNRYSKVLSKAECYLLAGKITEAGECTIADTERQESLLAALNKKLLQFDTGYQARRVGRKTARLMARYLTPADYSEFLLSLNSIELDERELFKYHLLYNDMVRGEEYQHKPHRHSRLRIGYISPDFRFHVMFNFYLAFFTHCDREKFEVYSYSLAKERDDYTKIVAAMSEHHLNIADLPPAAAAEVIYNDEIDILVDLAGHTLNNGLPILAYKPAPIIVSGLGYMATTGLKTVDYFLTDSYVDSDSTNEKYFTEKLYRLTSQFCYSQPKLDLPASKGAPAVKNGYITFGVFQAYVKITTEMLSVWQRILVSVPSSRLIIKNTALIYKDKVQAIYDRVKASGLPMDRVILEAADNSYPLRYLDIDIALDTYPYPGGGTTCDALYMGVPVITRYGTRHSTRFGYSLLSNAGLAELTAKNNEEYIRLAVALAKNIELLDMLHKNLRCTLEGSPVMDSLGYMHELEGFYSQIYDKYENGSINDEEKNSIRS